MKRRLAATVATVLLIAAGLTSPIHAFLGIGDIVFDPSNYAQAVEQVIRLEQQYDQLVRSYQMLRNQYNQLIWNAKQVPVSMAARYRAKSTSWHPSFASNTYGTTRGWINAINTGDDVALGYAQATETLREYGSALNALSSDQVAHLKTDYATVELTDGANQHGIETIGRLRDHVADVQQAILQLETDSLSSAPEMNTEVAVLNKINAAGVIAVRTGQDTNNLLAALAEHQVIAAKRARDAEARAINQHIRFLNEGRAVLTAQAAGASQAMLNWRMP